MNGPHSRTGLVARTALVAFCSALASGCFLVDRAAVGVERIGPDKVDVELNRNALTGPDASASTLETLHYFGLTERYRRSPGDALVELHRAVVAEPQRRFAGQGPRAPPVVAPSGRARRRSAAAPRASSPLPRRG